MWQDAGSLIAKGAAVNPNVDPPLEGYIGVIYRGYVGIMEKKMETTI